MTRYKYDFETVSLSEEQQEMMSLGIGDIKSLNIMIKDIINERAKEGWEPLYPFSLPDVWFKKTTTIRKKTTKNS